MQPSNTPKLDAMNLSSDQMETLELTFRMPGGIMVSGPCSSGKQTFLNSYFNDQAQFKNKAPFDAGEIRTTEDLITLETESDKESGWRATVHASSGLTALNRIKSNLGTSEFFTSDENVKGIVSTELITQLCRHCSIPITKESDHTCALLLTDGKSILSRLGSSSSDFQYRQRNTDGCKECLKNLVKIKKDNGEEITSGEVGNSSSLLLLSEITTPTPKLLKIFEEYGIEAAEDYFNTLFRFESNSNCAGESKTINGLRHLLTGTVDVDEFGAKVSELYKLEAHLKHLEESTLEAFRSKGIKLKSFGGFNIVDLISNKQALQNWRKEYAEAT